MDGGKGKGRSLIYWILLNWSLSLRPSNWSFHLEEGFKQSNKFKFKLKCKKLLCSPIYLLTSCINGNSIIRNNTIYPLNFFLPINLKYYYNPLHSSYSYSLKLSPPVILGKLKQIAYVIVPFIYYFFRESTFDVLHVF